MFEQLLDASRAASESRLVVLIEQPLDKVLAVRVGKGVRPVDGRLRLWVSEWDATR